MRGKAAFKSLREAVFIPSPVRSHGTSYFQPETIYLGGNNDLFYAMALPWLMVKRQEVKMPWNYGRAIDTIEHLLCFYCILDSKIQLYYV